MATVKKAKPAASTAKPTSTTAAPAKTVAPAKTPAAAKTPAPAKTVAPAKAPAAAKAPAPAKAAAPVKPLNKSQIVGVLSEKTGLSKVQVNSVLATLDEVIKQQLGKKGSGAFVLPGLLKLQVRMRPAQPAKKGRNPATGEEMTIPAKKASKRIAARPLKALKDAVL